MIKIAGDRAVAVFLDRDGTISEEMEYLSDPERLKLLPGSGEAVKLINDSGLLAVVLTNQSGVARGYFSEEVVGRVNLRLEELLYRKGGKIDAFYYCPHHPAEGQPPYRIDCSCRKPKTGMIDSAAAEMGIDVSRSFMIGDKLSDVEMAKRAGARGILVKTGYGLEEAASLKESNRAAPDYIAEDILDAVRWVIGKVR